MRITREQGQSYSGGGSSFFKLKDNESARVRFLYNTVNDIEFIAVHSLRENGRYATVDCSRLPSDPVDNCKWCANGDRPVSRAVIPMFNLNTSKVEYWVRSQSWVEGTLLPSLEQVPQGQPISGQTFIIKRTKTGNLPTDVSYSVQPELGSANDGKTKADFGEVKDAFECGAIQPNDYTFPVTTPNANNMNNQNYGQPQQNYGQQNNMYGNQNFTSTRRTNDVF